MNGFKDILDRLWSMIRLFNTGILLKTLFMGAKIDCFEDIRLKSGRNTLKKSFRPLTVIVS